MYLLFFFNTTQVKSSGSDTDVFSNFSFHFIQPIELFQSASFDHMIKKKKFLFLPEFLSLREEFRVQLKALEFLHIAVKEQQKSSRSRCKDTAAKTTTAEGKGVLTLQGLPGKKEAQFQIKTFTTSKLQGGLL